MAPSLTTLPCEIVHEILCHCSADDLARTRLVSSHFREPASRLLFRKLTFWHTPQSAAKVASIIASKHLRACVREFCFSVRTSNHAIDLYALLGSSNALPVRIPHTPRRLNLLDNLTVLRCHHHLGPTPYLEDDDLVDKFDTYRGEVLTTLIVGLAERGATSRKLEVLSISNLPCRSQPYLTDHPSFSALLRTLQTLSLRFDYDSKHDNIHFDRELRQHREFFTRLPRAWLAPASHDLTFLALGAAGLWGYLLKVDFRGVHFPRLKSLLMEDFVFSHDWQLDWILSHTSLQEMRLIQCWILIHAHWYGEKDNEGYPDGFSSTRTQNYGYDERWHRYYQHFSSLLGNLRCFTTMRDDGSAQTDGVGGYQTFHKKKWVHVVGDLDWRAEEEEALEHLKATTTHRSRQ